MANTFPIRFERASGLSTLFDAAGNSFGWKGAGLLRIDAEGIEIAVKRSLVSLLARRRSRRIPAESIRDVYRAGEALRVEFATPENPRATLPFWARDRESAAQIVNLLPTLRTFELEDDARESRKAGATRRAAWGMAAAMLVVVAAVLVVINGALPDTSMSIPVAEKSAAPALSPVRQEAAPALPAQESTASAETPVERGRMYPGSDGVPMSAEQARRKALYDGSAVVEPDSSSEELSSTLPVSLSATKPPPVIAELDVESFVPSVPAFRVKPSDAVIPIPQGTLAYDTAREVLAHFEARVAELDKGLQEYRGRFESGELSKKLFIERLIADREQWRALGARLSSNSELKVPALTGFLASLAAVVDYQMRFLDDYAWGLRTDDREMITKAFELQARAAEQLESARAYLN